VPLVVNLFSEGVSLPIGENGRLRQQQTFEG